MPEPGVLTGSCSPGPSGQNTSRFSSCKTFWWAYAWSGLSLLCRRRGMSRGRLRAFPSKAQLLIRKKNKSYNKKSFYGKIFLTYSVYILILSFPLLYLAFLFSQKLRKMDIFPLVPIALQARVAAGATCSRSWSPLRGSWRIQAFWEMQARTRIKSRACAVSNKPGWVLLRTCQLPPELLPVCRSVWKYPRPILEGGPQDFFYTSKKAVLINALS